MQNKNQIAVKKHVMLNRGHYLLTEPRKVLIRGLIKQFQHPHRLFSTRGFTLIELLVVVLIIGILTAVAVPQYRIAVYKSQLQALAPIMKSVKEAEISYRLANGSYTLSFEQLDIDLPVATPCNGNATTYGTYYPSAQCRDFGNSFCALNSNDSITCGIKNPLVRLDLYFYKRFTNGNWVCWGNPDKPLTMKICKAISNQKGDPSNGAHVFDF